MIDLEKIEGLTPELRATIAAQLKETVVSKADFDAVLSKKDELLAETKKAKQLAKEREDEVASAKHEQALKNNDIESLKASYELKLLAVTGELEGIKTQSKKQQLSLLSKNFVSEKFVSDPLIAEAIQEKFQKRLDMREGKTVVLDAEGNLTALSIADLQEEFLRNSSFKAHVIASNASGGGASGGNNRGGGASNIKTLDKAVTREERIAAIKLMNNQ